MSMLQDIQSTLSEDYIKEKLTLDERAKLLIDITNDLEWDEYDEFSHIDFLKAKDDLSFIDHNGH